MVPKSKSVEYIIVKLINIQSILYLFVILR